MSRSSSSVSTPQESHIIAINISTQTLQRIRPLMLSHVTIRSPLILHILNRLSLLSLKCIYMGLAVHLLSHVHLLMVTRGKLCKCSYSGVYHAKMHCNVCVRVFFVLLWKMFLPTRSLISILFLSLSDAACCEVCRCRVQSSTASVGPQPPLTVYSLVLQWVFCGKNVFGFFGDSLEVYLLCAIRYSSSTNQPL